MHASGFLQACKSQKSGRDWAPLNTSVADWPDNHLDAPYSASVPAAESQPASVGQFAAVRTLKLGSW